MKKRIINIVAAIVLASMNTFAFNPPSIIIEGTNAIIVDANNWKAKSLTVEITNEDGKMVFDNVIAMDNPKKFNFENLENGFYTVTLSNDYKTTIQEFAISDDGVQLIDDLETVYKPIIDVEEEYIDVNFMAQGKNTTISVFDSNNSVFETKIKNEPAISKRINIKDLPKGKYTIYVTSDNKSTWKRFKI